MVQVPERRRWWGEEEARPVTFRAGPGHVVCGSSTGTQTLGRGYTKDGLRGHCTATLSPVCWKGDWHSDPGLRTAASPGRSSQGPITAQCEDGWRGTRLSSQQYVCW